MNRNLWVKVFIRCLLVGGLFAGLLPVGSPGPVQAAPAAGICPRDVAGGFLVNGSVTVQVTAGSGGSVSIANPPLATTGSWYAPQILTPTVTAGQAIQVRFTAPKQAGSSSAFHKIQVNVGDDCYIMQAAAAAPFLMGYQYRFTTRTLDYIFMRGVNTNSLSSTSIIADLVEAPEFYDMDVDSLTVLETNTPRKYYEIYSVLDNNNLTTYSKLQFFPFSLGAIPPRPVDLTYNETQVDVKTLSEEIHDKMPVAAMAPNGVAAVAFWRKPIYGVGRIGVVFIDRYGAPVYPAGCTNGCMIANTEGASMVSSIVATSDNHFIVAWNRGSRDIGIAVFDATTYQQVGSTTYVLQGNAGASLYYSSPNLAAFNKGQKIFLSYAYDTPTSSSLRGYELNLNGGLSGAERPLVADVSTSKPLDAAFMDANHLLVSWIDSGNYQPKASLFNFTTNSGSTPVDLAVPDGKQKDRLGVIREYYGRGVITWADMQTFSHLYYALVDPATGALLTPPMVQFASPDIHLGTGTMATAYQPEPMFQLNIPLLRKN